ncbi:MAG: DNA repair protein RecO, partial [Pseudomonadota bacterium]
EHGRAAGLVRGARGRRLRPLLQTGNGLTVTWKARLAEQLGAFTVEAHQLRAGRALLDPQALAALTAIAALLRPLPERQPYPALFAALDVVLENLEDPALLPALYVRWEVTLLAALGFALDLDSCARANTADTKCAMPLAHVSPRTGRAVCAAHGAAYADRLLPLPAFLTAGVATGLTRLPAREDVATGLALTGHFLVRHVFDDDPARLPIERQRLSR